MLTFILNGNKIKMIYLKNEKLQYNDILGEQKPFFFFFLYLASMISGSTQTKTHFSVSLHKFKFCWLLERNFRVYILILQNNGFLMQHDMWFL